MARKGSDEWPLEKIANAFVQSSLIFQHSHQAFLVRYVSPCFQETASHSRLTAPSLIQFCSRLCLSSFSCIYSPLASTSTLSSLFSAHPRSRSLSLARALSRRDGRRTGHRKRRRALGGRARQRGVARIRAGAAARRSRVMSVLGKMRGTNFENRTTGLFCFVHFHFFEPFSVYSLSILQRQK